jgi:DNA-binding NarL/FixJ family response regulator
MAGLDDAALVSEVSDVDPPVRVVICDDHEVLRHGLRAVLRRIPGLVVVAEATCGGEVLSLTAAVHPDVVLVGLDGEGPALRDLVRELARTGIRVLLLGEAGDGSDLVEVLRAGASGYLHSTVSSQRLVDSVRAVARGETVLDAGVTGELLHRLEEDAEEPHDDGRGPARSPLTARQQTVAELVAQGLTNAEIADRLQVSRATVKGHVTVALRRLGLRDRTQLAIHVHRNPHPGGTGPSDV